MDLFAVVLVTVTIVTICGICFFICICSLQPKILHYFHRKKQKTYFITSPKKFSQISNDIRYVNNHDSSAKSSLTSINDREKREYIKILERSVRTGRRIQDEKNLENTRAHSFSFLRQYFNKDLSSTTKTTTNNIQRSTDI